MQNFIRKLLRAFSTHSRGIAANEAEGAGRRLGEGGGNTIGY